MTTEIEKCLYEAVRYVLDRAQTDADFGYLCGPGTRAFELLCAAEAEYLGETVEVVTAERAKDLSDPPREPKVVALARRIEQLEGQL